MALTALQVFNGAVPGLSEYTTDQKSLYIEMAMGSVSADYFLDDYQQALGLMAAHIAVMCSRDAGAVGAITGIREGDLSVNYSGASILSDDLGMTAPGQMLKRLILKHSTMGMVI